MYCRNCGKEIKEGSAFCGSCGKKISPIDDDKVNGRSSYSANKKSSVNPSIKTKRHKRKNKCMQWVIAVCLSIICFVGIIFAMKHNGMLDGLLQQKTILTQGDFTIISEEFTDIVVVDENSAVAAVKDALSLTGIDTAGWELTLEEVATINERCIYCIQQSVNGVEVYGRTATVITTDSGEVLGFTSNMVEVDDIEYNSSLSQSTAENSVNSYFEKQESEYQDITVQEISDDYQKLYMYEGEMILAYILPIFFGENTQSDTYVILNGSTGEVLDVNETMQSVSRTCFNSSWSINVTGWYEDETYTLYDEVRGLYIYSYKGTNSKSDKANSTLIKSENEVFGDTLDEKDENQDKGIELLYNVSLIKDYYTDVLNEDGFEMNRLSYDDGYSLGYNALGGTISSETGEVCGSLTIGKNMDVSNLDVLAHEYTHVITRKIVNWTSTNSEFDQADAINEAYSDIFAVLITGYLSGEELDWEVETGVLFGALDRNISDPELSGNPASVTNMTWCILQPQSVTKCNAKV